MAYKAPGVYVEEVSNLPPSVAPVETAIPAFIGYTELATRRGEDLTMVPTRITSLVEYEQLFGTAPDEDAIAVTITTASDGTKTTVASLAEDKRKKNIMWYALRMYFDNGGGPCYICSVGAYANPDSSKLEDGLKAVASKDEPTLLVFPEAQYLTIANYKSLHEAALKQCAELQDRFLIMDLHGGDGKNSLNEPDTRITDAVTEFRNNGSPANNLRYGAVYAPNLETTVDFAYDESQTQVTIDGTAAKLDTLKGVKDQEYNLAIAAIRDLPSKLPPAGAVAGVYATTDNTRGVWKAPANIGVANVIQPTLHVTNNDHGEMNIDPTGGKSVNAIRALTGLGTLVWGARTLAGNDNEWRYINVRRLCIFAEESIKKASMQFVFEPNDANTWVKLKGMIENFLTTLWTQGALAGAKVSDAFGVSVGLGSTMTALDILEGRMIVVVKLCPVRPAEFIVLRFVQTMPV